MTYDSPRNVTIPRVITTGVNRSRSSTLICSTSRRSTRYCLGLRERPQRFSYPYMYGYSTRSTRRVTTLSSVASATSLPIKLAHSSDVGSVGGIRRQLEQPTVLTVNTMSARSAGNRMWRDIDNIRYKEMIRARGPDCLWGWLHCICCAASCTTTNIGD